MQGFRHLLIGALILSILTPEVGGNWLQDVFRNIGAAIGGIAKTGCRVLFGVGCPAGVNALGGVIDAATKGVVKELVKVGVAAGVAGCQILKNNCKRSAGDKMQNMTMYPFSDEFTDYDSNGDKEIEYEEFAFSVMSQFPLADPEQLREPFNWADANAGIFSCMYGQGIAEMSPDMDEFVGAPFMFAHYKTEKVSET